MADEQNNDLAKTVELGELPIVREGDVLTVPKKEKKRRRGLGWLIALGVVIVLGVVGWIVGDIVARDFAQNFVREKVTEVFNLEPGADMDVTIGPGSLLAQALTGSIDSVDVSVPDVSFGAISGDLDLALTGIPLDTALPVDTMRVALAVPEANLSALSSYLSGAELTDISLVEDRVAIATEFQVFGFAVPVGVELLPAVVNGEIAFDPSVITVNGADISVEALREGPFAGIARDLLGQRSFCVGEYLPAALTLTDVDVVSGSLVVKLSGDGAALGGAGLSEVGTCPAA
ncbi:DUF2993 domain-containing protein [Glaciihabitans arcticus]|uniref:DUF2993 domain-containing protein n=1 Tax=Glaciihabitans arcticus TaxID=2668039 RepID=A0A4Q9GNM1_9MICO|nr:DUF2993 domain-containing protein [Glaciihabitans arcticus]TBN56301.1 DUF2993 domain-containing protein [Glaciihabitans arcticus]